VNLESLKAKLLALGLPGLFLISFLDSAGVPLPGGVDLVVMLLSWQRPSLFVVITLVAALGSTLGCLVLYRIARTGGDAMMSRFPLEKQERVKDKVRRNDLVAMLVAMLGPPPFPTKLFILVAGVVRMDLWRFAGAVFFGRAIRFFGESYLAVKLGDRAAATLKDHYATIGIALAAAVVAYLVLRRVLGRGPGDEARSVARELIPEIRSTMDSCDPAGPSGGSPVEGARFARVRERLPRVLAREPLFAVEAFYSSVAEYARAAEDMRAAFSKESALSLGDRIRAKDVRDRCLKDVYYSGEAALERLRKLSQG
jgi:membrane protein YqaA with SNARE-associated domain